MKKIGLWIDHRKAVIVALSDKGEEVNRVFSGIQRHIKAAGKTPWEASQEDTVDRQFENQLKKFYGDILPYLKQAESIQIFGPGKAKKELEVRLEKEGLKSRILGIKTMDKMTDRQVVAQIRRQIQ
jgi:hypothetical protein